MKSSVRLWNQIATVAILITNLFSSPVHSHLHLFPSYSELTDGLIQQRLHHWRQWSTKWIQYIVCLRTHDIFRLLPHWVAAIYNKAVSGYSLTIPQALNVSKVTLSVSHVGVKPEWVWLKLWFIFWFFHIVLENDVFILPMLLDSYELQPIRMTPEIIKKR